MERKERGVLIAIAVERLFKALVLIVASVGAFSLVDKDLPALGERVIEALGVSRDREVARWFLEKLAGVSDRTLRGIGAGGLAYALLQLAEGYGLFRQRVWAEWLTIVSTGSLVPFEVYEIVKNATVLKVAGMIVNVLIVAYLVVGGGGAPAPHPAPPRGGAGGCAAAPLRLPPEVRDGTASQDDRIRRIDSRPRGGAVTQISLPPALPSRGCPGTRAAFFADMRSRPRPPRAR